MRGCSENNGVFHVPEPVDKVGGAGDLLRGRRRRYSRKSLHDVIREGELSIAVLCAVRRVERTASPCF